VLSPAGDGLKHTSQGENFTFTRTVKKEKVAFFWLVVDFLGLAVSNDLSWALKSRISLTVKPEENSFHFNLVLNAPTQGQLHISKFKDLEKCKVHYFNAS